MDVGNADRKRCAMHGCKKAAHLLPLVTWEEVVLLRGCGRGQERQLV